MCLGVDIGVSTETDRVISNLQFRVGWVNFCVD